jgi:hypothetical protein
MPNMLKIGKTKKHPLERMKELSGATGVPTPFQLVYYQPCRDMDDVEKRMHDFFSKNRASENREFFAISLFKAATTLDGIIGAYSAFDPPTPFAELFATFDDRGDGKLNDEEIAKCRELKRQLS